MIAEAVRNSATSEAAQTAFINGETTGTYGNKFKCDVTKDGKFLCPAVDCDMTFVSENRCYFHHLDHRRETAPYACTICPDDNGFLTAERLEKHYKNYHMKILEARERESKRLAAENEKASQMKKKVKPTPVPVPAPVQTPKVWAGTSWKAVNSSSSSKPFKCSLCPASFALKKEYNSHILVHMI